MYQKARVKILQRNLAWFAFQILKVEIFGPKQMYFRGSPITFTQFNTHQTVCLHLFSFFFF